MVLVNRILLSPLLSVMLLAAVGIQASGQQMQVQAQRAALRPMKLDVLLPAQGVRVGTDVPTEVVLLDANNQNSTWEKTTTVHVAITSPSGVVKTETLTIPPGQSSANFNFSPSEPGMVSFKATDADNALRPGGNSVFVNRTVSRPARKARKSGFFFAPASVPRFLEIRAPLENVALSWTEQPDAGTGSSAVADAPMLLIANASGKDEILADGKDFARIRVFFMDPNENPAPRDITVWLSWSNGELQPQPLVIQKGGTSAEAQWTSNSPVNAKVTLVAVAPKYGVAAGKELDISFVPPIYGVGTPSTSPLKLSLVDAAPLTAQFFDQNGRAIQTDRPRRITFISSNPALHLDPQAKDVPAKESGTSIYLVPTWSGSATLDIWTPGYDHQTLTVEVTMWLVIVMCAGGGVVGGIAAKQKLQGSVLWRSFVGVLGAIVLVWFTVYAVLPRTHSIIAHNLVSVFVVGIIGGYGGIGVLDWGLKKLIGSKAQAAAT